VSTHLVARQRVPEVDAADRQLAEMLSGRDKCATRDWTAHVARLARRSYDDD